jgi:hypothetical protein
MLVVVRARMARDSYRLVKRLHPEENPLSLLIAERPGPLLSGSPSKPYPNAPLAPIFCGETGRARQ